MINYTNNILLYVVEKNYAEEATLLALLQEKGWIPEEEEEIMPAKNVR